MKLLRAWAKSSNKIIVEIKTEEKPRSTIWGVSVKFHDGDLLFNPVDQTPENIIRFRVNELRDTVEILTERGDNRVVVESSIEDMRVFDEDYTEIDIEESREYELDKSFNDLLDYKYEEETYSKEYFDGKIDDVKIYDEKIDDPEKRYNSFLENI